MAFQDIINQWSEISENIIIDVDWKKNFLEKGQKIFHKYALYWLKITAAIEDDETIVKRYVDIFFKAFENNLEDLVLDINTLYEKHIEIIAKNSEKMQHLQKTLGFETTATKILDDNELPLMKTHELIIKEIEKLEEAFAKKKDELNELKNKYTSLSQKLGGQVENLSEIFSPKSVEKLKEQVQTLESECKNREEHFLHRKNAIQSIIGENRIEIIENTEIKNELLELLNHSASIISEELITKIDTLYEVVKKADEEFGFEVEKVRKELEELWNCFDISMRDRCDFLCSVDGRAMTTLTSLKEEVQRLKSLKEANLADLINAQKQKLEHLWDLCHVNGKTRNDFPGIYECNNNDGVLNSLELEVAKWQDYYEENKQILESIQSHQDLTKQLTEISLNTNEKKLYHNRGGALTKHISKINILKSRIKESEQLLQKLAVKYRKENGREFLTFGKTISEYLKKNVTQTPCKDAPKSRQNTPSSVKSQLRKDATQARQPTPKSRQHTPSTSNTKRLPQKPPSSAKFNHNVKNDSKKKVKNWTPCSVKSTCTTSSDSKLKKIKKEIPNLPTFKINESRSKRLSWKPSSVLSSYYTKSKGEESWTSDYSEFEKELTTKNIPRSSGCPEKM